MRREFLGVGSAGMGALLLGAWPSSLWGRASGKTTYVVKKGDTLSQISRRYGIAVAELKKTNRLKSDAIGIGQTLQIPIAIKGKAVTHVVCKGDTLSGISRKYSVSVDTIKKNNGLKNNMIHPGQRLTITGQKISKSSKKIVSAKKYHFIEPVRRKIDISNLNRRRWKHIILHHSGTDTGSGKIFDYYHRKIRGMENGLAYHFVIGNGSDSKDGSVEIAERWAKQLQGGHVKSDAYNQNSIGICLVGNFERQRPTKKQIGATIELVDHIKNKLLRGKPKLLLHREMQKTLCPGRYFPARAIHRILG